MIYTTENTIDVGNPVKRVVDANGLEWHNVISVDTETGELTYQKRDANGQECTCPITGNIATETVKTAAPVVVEFC